MTIQRAFNKAAVCVFALLMMDPSVYGQKRWDAPSIVTTNCSGCHGIDGNSELRYFPRLAGLDPAYAEKKMAEFKETPSPKVDDLYGWMVNGIGEKKSDENLTRNERINMIGPAHAAKPEAIKQAVQWYSQQRPAPGRRGDAALMQQGQELFTKGVPDQGILPCMSCHGQDAEGQGTVPRLAGQNAEYTEAQMNKFRQGDRKHAPEMTMVAKELNPGQARAVAVYLESK